MTKLSKQSDDGQRGVLVAAFGLWLAVALVGCLLIVGVANRVVERTTAQSIADAAALAGAADGRVASEEVVRRNGGSLVAWEQTGSTVTVRVTYAGVAAEARAEKQIRPAASG